MDRTDEPPTTPPAPPADDRMWRSMLGRAGAAISLAAGVITIGSCASPAPAPVNITNDITIHNHYLEPPGRPPAEPAREGRPPRGR